MTEENFQCLFGPARCDHQSRQIVGRRSIVHFVFRVGLQERVSIGATETKGVYSYVTTLPWGWLRDHFDFPLVEALHTLHRTYKVYVRRDYTAFHRDDYLKSNNNR